MRSSWLRVLQWAEGQRPGPLGDNGLITPTRPLSISSPHPPGCIGHPVDVHYSQHLVLLSMTADEGSSRNQQRLNVVWYLAHMEHGTVPWRQPWMWAPSLSAQHSVTLAHQSIPSWVLSQRHPSLTWIPACKSWHQGKAVQVNWLEWLGIHISSQQVLLFTYIILHSNAEVSIFSPYMWGKLILMKIRSLAKVKTAQ